MSGDVTCAALSARKVAKPVNTPTVSTSPCENLITSSTPKNSVKPTATRPYIIPSISPLTRNWPKRERDMKAACYGVDTAARLLPSRPLAGRVGRVSEANADGVGGLRLLRACDARNAGFVLVAPPTPGPSPPRASRAGGGEAESHHFSFRLPEPYSLSSHTIHLPSCATYLVISGTVFCPWSSNVTGPMIES